MSFVRLGHHNFLASRWNKFESRFRALYSILSLPGISQKSLSLLYKSSICSVLSYAFLEWFPFLSDSLKKDWQVYHRNASRVITGYLPFIYSILKYNSTVNSQPHCRKTTQHKLKNCYVWFSSNRFGCKDIWKFVIVESTLIFYLATLNQSCFYSNCKPFAHLKFPNKNADRFIFDIFSNIRVTKVVQRKPNTSSNIFFY